MTRPEPHTYQPPMFGTACNYRGCGLDPDSPVHPKVGTPKPEHLSRPTDPPTSRKGAKSVQYRAKSQKSRLLVTWLGAPGQQQTGADAAIATGLDRPGVCWWHRVGDLRDDGLLADTGVEVRSPITGELVPVFALTDEGRVVAWRLRGMS